MSDSPGSGVGDDPARPDKHGDGSQQGGSSGSAGGSRGVPEPPGKKPTDSGSAGSPAGSAAGSAGGDSVDASATSAAPVRPPTPITQQIGRGVVILLAVAFGVFAVANSQHVEFSWLFGETTVIIDSDGERIAGGVRLIVLMIASLAVGMAIGAAWVWQAGRTKRRERR